MTVLWIMKAVIEILTGLIYKASELFIIISMF